MKQNRLAALVITTLVGWLVVGCYMQIPVEPEEPTREPTQETPAPVAEMIQPEGAKLHPEWTNYAEGNAIGGLVVQGEIVWASGKGVIRLDTRNGDYVALPTGHNLVDTSVTAVAAGPDGSIWFGTFGDGVSQLMVDGTWRSYTVVDGLAENYVWAIAAGLDSSMLFGTAGGLSQLSKDGTWATTTMKDGLAADSVSAIAVAPDGSLWFGSEVSGVSHLSADGTWTTYMTEDGLSSPSISAITAAPDGSMWFGGIGPFAGYYAAPTGVSQLGPDGVWTTYTSADGLAGDYVSAIAAGPDGSMWFSTFIETRDPVGGGVSRLGVDGTWTTYTTADGLASDSIHSIVAGPDGSMWFGGSGGLSRYLPAN